MRGKVAAKYHTARFILVPAELENVLALCRDIKQAAPDQAVILTVHEMKRLARNAAELMTPAATLQAAGIQLELLTGPLTGVYDPNGMGAMLFAVPAVAAQLDREYIREKTLEGQQISSGLGPCDPVRVRGDGGEGLPAGVVPAVAPFVRVVLDVAEPVALGVDIPDDLEDHAVAVEQVVAVTDAQPAVRRIRRGWGRMRCR